MELRTYLDLLRTHAQRTKFVLFSLRLRMYRGLGFEPILDKHGKIIKMLVREYCYAIYGTFCELTSSKGAQSGDIHTVEFTNDKTDAEYTRLLWKLASP